MRRICYSLLSLVALSPQAGAADYAIPFSDLEQIIAASGESPDATLRAYLAGLIREELDDLGFDVNGGLVLDDIPLDAITEIIETDCDFPRPYEVHTDATTATVALGDDSGLTLGLDSIRSIDLHADLAGSAYTEAGAWVRWGQDIPFVGDCISFETDHGWVALTLPFDVELDLALELVPTYDAEQIAIVVDKHAVLTGTAALGSGNLQHDFGSFSLTDVLIDIFEDELLAELQSQGTLAVDEAIAALNYRLDGRDENGDPDPSIDAFNGPTVFALQIDEDDEPFVRDLLAQLGVAEYLIEMLDDRGIEILLQLVVLDDAEREAYLAELGATTSCDVLLDNFEAGLDHTPLHVFDGQACVAADPAGAGPGPWYSDPQCTQEQAYRPRDDEEFCVARFGEQAGTVLGNAAAWTADTDQPGDPLPSVPSRAWTMTAGTLLDIGVVPLTGNRQPYMKQLNYKSVTGLPRGNGRCDLEMRVYKTDITAGELRPMLAFHGGTWRHRGFSFFGLEAGISQMTERGFVVFAPFYRLVDESDGNTECNAASWREVTEDAESALGWVRANGAAFGAKDMPVTVFGQSAGAHLAGWLAAHRPDDVRKALLHYAPTDVLDFLVKVLADDGEYAAFRDFGLRSLARFYGAERDTAEIRFDRIDLSGITPALLADEWATRIPGTAFELAQLDPAAPPPYLARCAASTDTDLAAIDLSQPPSSLIDCLKADLRDFLLDNSFNHLLGGGNVPIHVVQGTADSLVPVGQALELCAAIDGSPQPDEFVAPLTTLACGSSSEMQIVLGAEHALELGVCLDSLCPAGPPGSATREAAAMAISLAWQWLLADPSLQVDVRPVRRTGKPPPVPAPWLRSTAVESGAQVLPAADPHGGRSRGTRRGSQEPETAAR